MESLLDFALKERYTKVVEIRDKGVDFETLTE